MNSAKETRRFQLIFVITPRCPGFRLAMPKVKVPRRPTMPQAVTRVMQLKMLFQPIQLGPYLLANRIVMAPLTRGRATEQGVPTALMAQYYAQRASAGLIISEGVNISVQGRSCARTPGLYDKAQAAGWRKVTGHGARAGRAHLCAALARGKDLPSPATALWWAAGRTFTHPAHGLRVHRAGLPAMR